MAIAIEGFTVVGLKARIAEKFDGGLPALSKVVLNATELQDDDLWRCSFMASADAHRLLAQLQQAGLNTTDGPDPDLILIHESDLSVAPYCEWVEVARWDKGVIAWRVGTTPRSVIARQGWSPERGSGLSFMQPADDDRLEFLRREGNVSVYFDKQQGCEVYLGRTAPDPNEVFKEAGKVIFAQGVQPGMPPLVGDANAKVAHAVADLETIAQRFPDQWRAHFVIGKGKLALGNLDEAYGSLRRAYELETEDESIPRELAGVCLMLGRAGEAIEIGQRAAALQPDNSETLGNLACAYLIGGRLNEALTTIGAALKRNPQDRTNLLLQTAIHQVMSGKRPQPRQLGDLMQSGGRSGSAAPRPPERAKDSLWSRLQFWKWRR